MVIVPQVIVNPNYGYAVSGSSRLPLSFSLRGNLEYPSNLESCTTSECVPIDDVRAHQDLLTKLVFHDGLWTVHQKLAFVYTFGYPLGPMPIFSSGDIVRIARQPDDVKVHIVGEVGYIDSLSPTHAGFLGLKLDGSTSGGGSVKLYCLEHENSAQWRRAKEIHDREFEQRLEESRARTERYHARMTELSAKYGISVENVKALYSDIEELSKRDWWPE